MRTRFLIRLDDACPTMSHEKWERMEMLLDKYSVQPMVGVIPHNEDPKQQIDSEDIDFWNKVLLWEKKEWVIALHGYNHVYSTKEGGINPLWQKSEFAGQTIEIQKDKIRKGVTILSSYGINPKYFFAPSHTFDENTLVALKEESEIRIISDCVAFKPFVYNDFIFIPQVFGHCIKLPFRGIYTFCFHPNTMSDKAFEELESFLKAHYNSFINWNEIDLCNVKTKSIADSLFSYIYFSYRRIRGLR